MHFHHSLLREVQRPQHSIKQRLTRNQINQLFSSVLQDELNSDLDLSEARASLLSGDVVELINATSVDSTSMKLLWEVSRKRARKKLKRAGKISRRLSHGI
jgi:hypothetical protein